MRSYPFTKKTSDHNRRTATLVDISSINCVRLHIVRVRETAVQIYEDDNGMFYVPSTAGKTELVPPQFLKDMKDIKASLKASRHHVREGSTQPPHRLSFLHSQYRDNELSPFQIVQRNAANGFVALRTGASHLLEGICRMLK